MDTPLSLRQQQALEFIRSTLTERGYSPSYEEIRQHLGLRSLNAVRDILIALERKGYIRRQAGRSRTLTVTDQQLPMHAKSDHLHRRCETVPIISSTPVDSGNLLALFLRPRGLLSVDAEYFRLDGKSCFAAIAPDNSMAEAGINAGDTLLLEQTDSPGDGDIVLCVAQGQQLLRRYTQARTGKGELRARGHLPIRLESEQQVQIVGVVRWILRAL